MDNDVSVARLSDEDGSNDRLPPEPHSRVRLLAVMGSVVVGCGLAATVVSLGTTDTDDTAGGTDGTGIILDTHRTSLDPSSTSIPSATSGDDTTESSSVSADDKPADPAETDDTEPGDDDHADGEPDERREDSESSPAPTTEPETSGDPSDPPPTSSEPSTPPSTTPPEEDEDEGDEEEEECTPKWWVGCW